MTLNWLELRSSSELFSETEPEASNLLPFHTNIRALVTHSGVDEALVNVSRFHHLLEWRKRPTFANVSSMPPMVH